MIMKKVICLLSLLACLFPVTGMAQGLHFGLKAGVLGNKADIHGMSSQIKEENQTGFQVGPMLQYQTGFYGLALDFFYTVCAARCKTYQYCQRCKYRCKNAKY